MKMVLPDIQKKFIDLFQTIPKLYYAPGRINLLGEHTDYNDGFVLPAAIDKTVSFAILTNDKNIFRFYALDLDEYVELSQIKKNEQAGHWSNYLLGVLAQFQKKGIILPGVDCVFGGNIPIGAGLSSSAAIECGFAFGVNDLIKSNFTKYELVRMAQKAEHEYAGVMCGIMDQYASMFGKKGYALKLDCRSHEHIYFPLELEHHVIALVDTGVKHTLASSEYNIRRKECETGVEILKQSDPSVTALRDVSIEQLENNINKLDPTVFKRCLYVVKENERVHQACKYLQNNNLEALGKLMYQTHEGLKNEYEVSCSELDILVDLTKNMDDVPGARMMGGGFGGCTINLVKRSGIEKFESVIKTEYQKITGIKPHIYLVKIIDGATYL